MKRQKGKTPSTSQGERPRVDFSLLALGKAKLANTLTSDIQSPELGDEKFPLFEPPSVALFKW